MKRAAIRWETVWALLIAASAAYFLSDNEADNDLWIHLRVGLDILRDGSAPSRDSYSYTASDATWIDHEWLLHVVLGAIYEQVGSPGLLLFKIVVAAATVGVVAPQIWRGAVSVHVRGIVLLLTIAVLARGFAIRPQIVTYLAVALLLGVLRDPHRRPWLLAAGLAASLVLWANLHGGVIVGAAIIAMCALWVGASDPSAGLPLGTAVVGGTALALLLNPYGLSFAGYLWSELSAPHPITEWQPIAVEASQATFFVFAATFALTLPFTAEWRKRGWQVILAALFLAMALRQQRHTPLFAIAAAPIVAANLDGVVRRLGASPAFGLSHAAQRLLALGIALIAALQIFTTAGRLIGDRFRVVFDAAEYPLGAVRFLQESRATGNAAVPLDWGGYLLWHLGPRVQISLDGRFATLYPPSVVETNFDFFLGAPGWRRLIDDYPTDLVIAPPRPAPPVDGSSKWRKAYEDAVAGVWVRSGTEADRALAQVPHTMIAPKGSLPFP